MKKAFSKIRRACIALMAVVVVAGLMAPLAVQADGGISVTIDGVQVVFEDQTPVIIENRTLVPVGGVFGALGFTPSWNQDAQTATLTRSDFTVVITIGSAVFTTNGEEFTLDVPAQIIESRTMLPLRAVLESIGIPSDNIGWDGDAQAITVVTESEVATTDPAPAPDEDDAAPEEDAAPDEDDAAPTAQVSSFQQILDEYSAKIRAATPGVIADFRAAAVGADVMELIELSLEFVTVLAEISIAGTERMAELHVIHGVGTWETYLSYSMRLSDVYMEESQQITDLVMELALGF